MILFLDFDGVLHPVFPRRDLTDADNQLFSFLPRLEGVLRDFPEILIVIASSWREGRPWEHVIKAFSPDIAARIIGATPVIKAKWPPYPQHPRYDEILAFLDASGNQDTQWIVLDDDHVIYPPDCPNLILCADGFCDNEESLLREVLSLRLREVPSP